MNGKDIVEIFSRPCGVSRPSVVKRCLLVLVLVAAMGTLGLISSSDKVPQQSWPLNSDSSVFHPHFFINLVAQKSILADEDDTIDKYNFNIEGYKKLFNLFSIANPRFLISPNLNLTWETICDSINSSPYTSFFALLPLRSPPLFS